MRSSLEIEDVVLGKLRERSEVVVVPDPNVEPVPVICTHEDQPLDPERRRAATSKVRRIELSRRLHEQPEKRA